MADNFVFLDFSKNLDDFRRVRASRRKCVYWLRRVYPSARPPVCPRVSVRLALDGFS